MRIAFLAFVTLCLGVSFAFAQTRVDSTSRSLDAQSLDSAYRARKALLDAWVRSEGAGVHPQSDFISASVGYGGYVEILPRDLSEYFAERTLIQNPARYRNQSSTVDRMFLISCDAQLAETWGIYFEYDLTMKFLNISVDSAAPAPYNISGATEDLDLTEHSLVVGGMYVLVNSSIYRLRATGGIGGVIAFTSETESTSGASRSASATGYQVNFDLLNDFRVAPGASFTIDLLARTVTTGTLTESGGQTLQAPFGAGNPKAITLQPTASSFAYGIAGELVIYF